jgi:WG repeat protein
VPERTVSDILPFINLPRDARTKLLPVVVNGKCGFIDRDGKIVIEPEFDKCHDFSDERAVVMIGSKTIVIDENGQTVFEPKSRLYGAKFSDGLISVCSRDDTCAPIGYLDKDGRMAIQPQFTTGYPFSEGRALISVESTWGYIDKTGRTVIPPKFLNASPFSNGLAYVQMIETTPQWRTARWFLIDKNGKIVRSLRAEEPRALVNGFAPSKWNGFDWTLIDETGNIAFHPQFDTAQISVAEYPRLCDGLIRVHTKGPWAKWGYADLSGRIVIPPQFAWAQHFSEGLAVIKMSGEKFGYIDKTGTVVIKAEFDRAHDFIGGIARVEFGRWISRSPCSGEFCPQSFGWDSEMGYIDRTGRFIWKPTK